MVVNRQNHQYQLKEKCLNPTKHEGIIPALESAHAVHYAIEEAKAKERKENLIVVNLSGRRGKDFVGFFCEANALHRNFYENEMEKESVEILAGHIEKLITKLKEVD
jgi:predicted alternative tryptophan synthase beta-subunit